MTTDAGAAGTRATDDRMAAVFGLLLAEVDPLADALTAEILDGEWAYAESTLLDRGQLRGAVHDNLRALLSTYLGQPPDLDAPRAAGRLKAEQGIPLAALLHAYRLAGRFIWDRLLAVAVDQDSTSELLHMASDMWVAIDEYSSAAAEAYRATVEERSRRDAAARGAMLASLLDGRAGNSGWETVRILGLDRQGPLVVVCVEGGDEREPLAALETRLRAQDVGSVWLQQAAARVGLLAFADGRAVADVVERLAAATGSRIGVSRPFVSPVHAPHAWHEAQLAVRCLPPRTNGSHVYGSSPVALMTAAAPDAAGEVVRAVFGPLRDLPEQEQAVLLDTLEAWFASGGSTALAATRLHCHRNTVLYRLNRITDLTGRRTSDAGAAAELYIALHAVRQGVQ
ncbi:PucR family transcriptional regulator [Yinghuangia seranimata]|uniref:PucR family transcriptional regulator n=1 Tax=Yinghuangia seranimata TaxID=408067 RepID=UPI00248AD20A|nr:helix-turn-helix domain-containing protein [Yinghuangia seranimata]MDI2124829.1 helix-turn-helix domain-containing protein [Yinghuangia seranimata]